jgi:UDP-glucose:(heptosyl)LPS alpha-1,3-glucosyltransferase
MKIGLCYPSMVPGKGGCETYIADLARRLVLDDHEVHLFAGCYDPQAFPANVHHHAVDISTGPRYRRPWKFASACAAALREHAVDVSVGFIKTWGQDVLMPQGGLHAASAEHNIRKHRSPLVRGIVRLVHALDLKHRSYRRLERKQLLDYPSLVVVPSRMVQRHVAEYYGGHPGVLERVRVVHNAIDTSRFPAQDRLLIRSRLRERHHLSPGDAVGLFVGHNYRLKGLVPLLHAVRNVPRNVHFRLLICGAKHYQRYEQLAERLGILDQVRFLGFVPDVREAFFASDFLVHPSFYDPCALVTLEALACGLPVITTKLNGAWELLPPALAALTVDTPHDRRAMAERITKLCHHGDRVPLARAAREAAQAWTFEHHFQALMRVFEEVAARKRPAMAVSKPGRVS